MSNETTSQTTFIPGKNGGRLRNGGTNKGGPGRPPEWFKDLCREMIASPKARAAVKAILGNPDHPHFASMWKAVSERGYGKPEQKIETVHKHYREAIAEVRQGLRLVG
jgi:hypothetical protein